MLNNDKDVVINSKEPLSNFEIRGVDEEHVKIYES